MGRDGSVVMRREGRVVLRRECSKLELRVLGMPGPRWRPEGRHGVVVRREGHELMRREGRGVMRH